VKWGIHKHNTIGGITIKPKAQVTDWEGNVIPGLYAAGEVAGAMDTIGLARPLVFGRIAGMTIASEE
jgi:succinate dehydrogenase/fumarate reductase flavoprotein subunit